MHREYQTLTSTKTSTPGIWDWTSNRRVRNVGYLLVSGLIITAIGTAKVLQHLVDGNTHLGMALVLAGFVVMGIGSWMKDKDNKRKKEGT